MATTAPEPHVYRPLPRWRVCVGCGAMWTGYEDACWACGGEGHPSRSPSITSQYGFGVNNVDPPPVA